MTLRLEQVFYGRGERGYCVLGASPGDSSLAAQIEKLCGSVGTPGSNYGGEPFLISVPEGEHVLMVCGRRGTPDSMGRDTLFFHALAATKKELGAAKANAFTLFDQGAFAAKMPVGTVEALRIDCNLGRDGSASRPPDGRAVGAPLPCFVRSSRPAPDIVRSFVGGRENDLAWATFAFQSLDRFDVQVLPPRTTAPRSMNECDADGKLVRAAETSVGRTEPACSSSASYHDGTPKQPQSSSKPSVMLKISLFANLALLASCVAIFASRKPVSTLVPKPEPTVVMNTATNTATNTAMVTNDQTRVMGISFSGSDGEKRPAQEESKNQEESKKEFLSKLVIPDLVTEDELNAIPAFSSTDFSEIKNRLSAIVVFIQELQQQKEQQ